MRLFGELTKLALERLVSLIVMKILDWAMPLLYERLNAIYMSIRSRLVKIRAHISDWRDDNDSLDLTTLERIPADVRADLRGQDEVQQKPYQLDQEPDMHDEV